jgi:hypothetical protein
MQEAKNYLHDNWKKGVHCPCCGQLVKLYKYKMDASKALGMICAYKLDKKYNGESFHLTRDFSTFLKKNANALHYTKMQYYDFLRPDTSKDDPAKKGSGWYNVTQKGRDFVEGRTSVPGAFYVYDGKCIGFGKETVNIHDALAEKFNYEELMKETV